MKTVILAYFTAILWHPLGVLAPTPPVVKTPMGYIEGIRSKMNGVPVKSFLGIPFAKPPLGSLRFLKPEPAEPWSGTLKATEQPPACMQYSNESYPWYDDMPGKSEDCLYLDIYTPFFATKGRKYAVIFWIYGGGFTLGSNRMDVYDGRVLASEESVIMVVPNYRLGLFGFFTTDTSDAPGNVGIYDTVLALQWVNDNIQYFGGDKDRITMAGESAGSLIVSIMCVSPLTKGLFSRAILESGSLIMQRYNQLENNLELSERLAEAVNCATDNFTIYNHPSEVVECMKSRNATDLTMTLWSFNPTSTRSFFEQYGNALLPSNVLDDIRNGNFHNVSILAGDVKDEGAFQITTGNIEEFGFFGKKDPQVNKTYATELLQGIFKNYTDPQKYIHHYLGNVSNNDYYQIRNQVITANGDASLLCPTIYFAESYADQKNDVYYYFFTHRPSNSPWAKWMGVVHFSEVQFVFGRPIRVPEDYIEDEVWLSKQVMHLWANFAKDGNPGSKWPKYSNETNTYLTLDVHNFGKVGIGPHLENCNFLRSYFGF